MSYEPANPLLTAESSEDMFLAAQATSGDHVVDEDPDPAWPDGVVPMHPTEHWPCPLCSPSGPVPGSAGTTGPSEPAAGLQRLHLFNDTTRERLDECDVDDPNNVVFGWEPNHALISINDPRLAVSDDDLAALARLKACRKRQAGHVVQFGNDLGLTASAHADDLLAYLRGEG